jgi:hypothetical protein
MQLLPLFEKAGVDVKHILSMLNINDLEGLFDLMKMARQRQKEIFEEIISTGQPIAPRELGEHKGMLDYAYFYITTKDFDLLPEDRKQLIEGHIRAREALISGAVPTPGLPPGPMAQPEMAPPPAIPPIVPQG